MRLLTVARRGDDRDPDRHRRDRRLPDAALEPGRPGGHARPAHVGLPAPAAALARVLHPHAHGRRAEPDRERHRRDRHRRHLDRDLGALERDHRASRRSSRWSCSTGASRSSPSCCCRCSCWLTKRVGDQRKKVTAERQVSLADVSSIVQESLSVSRDPARQDDGPLRATSPSASRASRAASPSLEVRSRMTGRWMMAAIQMTFAVMPALVYWFAGWSQSRGQRVDRRSARSSPSRPCRRACSSRSERCSESSSRCRARWRSSTASSSTSTSRSTSSRARATLERPRGDVAFDRRLLSLRRRRLDAGGRLVRASRPARRRRSSARPARARRRAAISSRASTTQPRAPCSIDGIDVRELTFESLAAPSASSRRRPTSSTRPCARTFASRSPTRRDEEVEEAARAAQIHELIASLAGRATRRSSASAATASRAARSSGWRSRGPILRNPPILVLDEATSALDTQTERLVQEALERLAAGAHDDRDRAPALDGPRRRPDRRPRRRSHRRAGHARRAAGAGWALRRCSSPAMPMSVIE